MKRRMRQLLLLLSQVVLVLACGNSRVLAGQLRADLATATPPGTTVEAVDHYLTSRNIKHSYSERTRTMNAIIRDVRIGWFVSTSVTMTFTFDENRRLMEYVVKEVHTGP